MPPTRCGQDKKEDANTSDFKLGNVFVTTAGVVKILDFGIARAVSGNMPSHDVDVGNPGALTPACATIENALVARNLAPGDTAVQQLLIAGAVAHQTVK